VTNARRLLEDLVSQLTAQDEVVSEVPEPSPPGEHRRLCLGMSTFDDFDGVYFTVQAARLYHPEVLDQVSFLVLDNHPEGRAAAEDHREHKKHQSAGVGEQRHLAAPCGSLRRPPSR